MPTQEQINAANVELQIANDNYAALANKYNQYQEAFKAYANATPEQQERARGAMQNLLDNYNQLQLNMRAAEDRIAVAQNAVNNLNTYVAQQPTSRGGQRRRIVKPTNDEILYVPAPDNSKSDELRLSEYLNAGYSIGDDGLMYAPNGLLVNYNGYGINASGQFVPVQPNPEIVTEQPIQSGTDTNVPITSTPITSTPITNTPFKQSYYDIYAQMKGTGTPSIQVADWFRGNLGPATSHTASLVRNDLAKRGYTTQQINDFVQDWGNATLAGRNVQYNLNSPQRIKTYGNEQALRSRGNGTPTI